MRICGKRNHELPPGCNSIADLFAQGWRWLESDWLKQCFLPYGHSGPCKWGQQS